MDFDPLGQVSCRSAFAVSSSPMKVASSALPGLRTIQLKIPLDDTPFFPVGLTLSVVAEAVRPLHFQRQSNRQLYRHQTTIRTTTSGPYHHHKTQPFGCCYFGEMAQSRHGDIRGAMAWHGHAHAISRIASLVRNATRETTPPPRALQPLMMLVPGDPPPGVQNPR